ncbi:glycoside hydrolase family 9 protein [Streptomyces sp. H27-C3]|uniref:glycoside hydrolase family 9 protein n=1 Tax=Streptomyces sp. H27-C3 TaxID=3046305 RepID=UPI0024B94E25|nr:glycoside hydrolase family 9 protein [Streptomyces sp. H27-C3]MDJ0463957.1 glycoside hydrolase family 9 protein [Streptomyces sp. H27-C3]
MWRLRRAAQPTLVTSLALAVATGLAGPAAQARQPAPEPAERPSTQGGGHVRVDQLGYAAKNDKWAYLMTPGASAGARFVVRDARGRQVLSGRAGADLGKWNEAYQHVHGLDLKALHKPGKYRVEVGGLKSPQFTVGGGRLFDGAADKTVTFFASQRDGKNVIPGSLERKPSHLTDRAAQVYDWPVFAGPDTDQTVGELKPIGGPVDVEGGWYDAGDYLKFTHIAAYTDTLLWASARDARHADPKLLREARHGLSWLDKMWDEKTRTLYIQVGAGAGNAEGTYVGDHDVWRLPEEDDLDADPAHRFLKNRPVFRAAAPGKPISPNIAGRTAAAFAVAAQVETDPSKAWRHINTAAQIYAQAQTTGVDQLVTSLPFAFYPESVWRDDLELGAAELALAGRKLGDPRSKTWLRDSARWAKEYLAHDAGGDTLNLYDVSALAHADLLKAIRAHRVDGLAVGAADLTKDLKAQLEIGRRRAVADPFRAGAAYNQFDAVPHAFGLNATARLYRGVTGDRSYDAFGTQQRNWSFGANPWGVSFMVGVGENFEQCPHHQIANIKKSTAIGAVVNGPNSEDLFTHGLGDNLDRMNPCPPDAVDRNEEFTGRGSRYVDDVRSWQSSEPADDFAAIATYALTLEAR